MWIGDVANSLYSKEYYSCRVMEGPLEVLEQLINAPSKAATSDRKVRKLRRQLVRLIQTVKSLGIDYNKS